MKRGVLKPCPQCQSPVYHYAYQVAENRHCSIACSRKSRVGKPSPMRGRFKTIERACDNCGVIYRARPCRLKFGRQTTCSRKCSYAIRGKKPGPIDTRLCHTCGVKITRPVGQFGGIYGVTFCSDECKFIGYKGGSYFPGRKRAKFRITEVTKAAWLKRNQRASKTRMARGWKPSEATRKKLSLATISAMANGKYKWVSKLEDDIDAIMRTWGIAYARQKSMWSPSRGRGFSFDFWFEQSRTAIEVNGTFWHADPRTYATPKYPCQISRVASDKMKAEFCAERGIRLLTMWEADFKRDPDGSMKRLLANYLEANREAA